MCAAEVEAVPRRLKRSRVAALGRFLAQESLPIIVCCAFVALVAALSGQQFSTDAWLALLGGRVIMRTGLPHHETLTVLSQGREWIDQQWLGPLGFPGLPPTRGRRP